MAVKVDVGCYIEIRVGIISVAIVNILGNLSQLLGSLYIIRKTKCSGISEQNVPFLKRNVPLNSFFY